MRRGRLESAARRVLDVITGTGANLM